MRRDIIIAAVVAALSIWAWTAHAWVYMHRGGAGGGAPVPGILLIGGDSTSCLLIGGDSSSCQYY